MAHSRFFISLCLLATAGVSGCAKDSAFRSEDLPYIYTVDAVAGPAETCAAMADEVAMLDAGLGGPAEEIPPPVPAGAASRWGDYGKDLVVQTVIGPLQPIIQTVKAASNYDDKTRLRTETDARAATRRAYLLGRMDGAGCANLNDALNGDAG